MNIDQYEMQLATGVDIPIPECQLILHQPTLKEISYIGEDTFFLGIQTITVSKNMLKVEDKSLLDEISNFQVFMTIVNSKESKKKKDAVISVFQIFRLGKPTFTPQSIILTEGDQNFLIDINNFEALQNVIKIVACFNSDHMDQQAFNPANDKAKEIADKLMRGRERVAAQNGAVVSSVFSRYLSVLTVGLHVPLQNLVECTMFQLYDLLERYILYINWDLDIRTRLAGGSPDSQPEDWMKSIH